MFQAPELFKAFIKQHLASESMYIMPPRGHCQRHRLSGLGCVSGVGLNFRYICIYISTYQNPLVACIRIGVDSRDIIPVRLVGLGPFPISVDVNIPFTLYPTIEWFVSVVVVVVLRAPGARAFPLVLVPKSPIIHWPTPPLSFSDGFYSDTNRDRDATDVFQKLNNTYQTLCDPSDSSLLFREDKCNDIDSDHAALPNISTVHHHWYHWCHVPRFPWRMPATSLFEPHW